MKTSITSNSITEGQRKQYKRFVEDAADKALAEAALDKDGLQQIIENGDGLKSAIVAKLKEFMVTNAFANEEVSSSFGYKSGYKKPMPIAEQVARLKKFFPELKEATYNEKLAERPLPPGAEGWFAIPRFEVVAGSYNYAVYKVLNLIKEDRNGYFINWLEGLIGEEYLRQSARSVSFWQRLGEEQQGHDILIVAAQFGLRHRGRSVRRARMVFTANEFGLGVFAVGVMILTHPNRLKHEDDLLIDCAGDEYAPRPGSDFLNTPSFDFVEDLFSGWIRFRLCWVGSVCSYFGSPSALLPQ